MPAKRKRSKKSLADVRKQPPKIVRHVAFTLSLPRIRTSEGVVLTCGQGDMGQLGLGAAQTMRERKYPTPIVGIPPTVDICAGGMHSLILTKEGQVYSFGCNDEGALGRDTPDSDDEYTPMLVALPGKALCLSAGDSHSACILEDGRVFAWGTFRDSNGNMGLNIKGNQRLPVEMLPGHKVVQIASGVDHLVMLTQLGRVYTVGRAEQGQLGRVAMRTASGRSRRGRTSLLTPSEIFVHSLQRFDAIWASNFGTFLREQKTRKVYACGLNNYRQLAVARQTDVVCTPIVTQLGTDVLQIAGGEHHTLVLNETHEVQVIGKSHYGRLGLGNNTDNVTALQSIEKLASKQIAGIACGMAQSFAIDGQGVLYAWGMASNLQLGNGIEMDALEPVQVCSKLMQEKRVVRVSSGGQHTLFLVTDEPPASATAPTKPKYVRSRIRLPIVKLSSESIEDIPSEEKQAEQQEEQKEKQEEQQEKQAEKHSKTEKQEEPEPATEPMQ